MMTRLQAKERSAQVLNRISADVLFDQFQITRVGELTGLDHIGIPVWAATRPCAHIVSVTAGKNLDTQMARAGAIAESIEYSSFDYPRGDYTMEDWSVFSPLNMLVAKGANWKDATNIAVEHVTQLVTEQEVLFPSDLIWMGTRGDSARDKKGLMIFQRTSNGQAVAGSFEEAFLAGLYECIERDAITIRTCALEQYARIPPKQDLHYLVGNLAVLRDKILQAGLRLFLFYCTFDIPLPVYWAIVIDPSSELPPFAGWGCNLDSRIAAERAILEAVQSRLVYISGARDDIQRRNFDLLRNQDHFSLIQTYESQPSTDTFLSKTDDLEPWMEKAMVLNRLKHWQKRILYKYITTSCGFHAVKVFVLGLEPPISLTWQPSRWLTVRKYYEDQHNLLCRPNFIWTGDQPATGRVMVSSSGSG